MDAIDIFTEETKRFAGIQPTIPIDEELTKVIPYQVAQLIVNQNNK